MISQFADPANAITASGLAISIMAINLAVFGHLDLAVAVALWSLLADHLDGVVATRTQNRAALTGHVGKSLDSLADLVSAGVFPGVLIAKASNGAPWGIATAVVLALASALRLSHFNSVGHEGRYFIGLPTTYALPVTAAVVLISPLVDPSWLGPALALSMLIVAALHVSSLRVPATRGAMYAVVVIYCILASWLLTARELQM
ncbi:CDP-alcohol phosphatidyltransferase family protein [Rhizobium azibense]|uniref:CDP-diacylglycerol--serine O-phosphatidyltransferase n=1 Tax=Rhizobium azibense TaxID=1136135 RepID=A0A4R3RD62_9HYPH|nr:CDP-alcohol phosphatidyltransferase family protein [Rhizobium azibense]TCU32831.1 CDP-diacylglycerol--serine O-phosphatidyltransferase [Rhizobium azibense]